MIWFTSDSHYGHESIIRLCNRPWTNVVDMDIALINNWNSKVAKEDEVWFLGDFTWYKDPKTVDYLLESLNGKKHLIKGNHEPYAVLNSKHWESIQDYKELVHNGRKVVLFHYPIADWNGRFRQSVHLFGHVHTTYKPPEGELAYEVGVDNNNYYPVNLDDIFKKLGI